MSVDAPRALSLRPRRRRTEVCEVYELTRAVTRPSSVMVSVPHAGLDVPDDVRAEILVDEEVMRADADLAVDELYGGVPEEGANLLAARLSRYVVDLNRSAGDVDRLSVPEHPSPLADAPRGVIWRTSTCGRSALARPLSLSQLQWRLGRFHEPYHAALRGLLSELRDRHGQAILCDGHSMPSHGRATGGGWRRRADIVPGCDGGSSCSPDLVDAIRTFFEARGYSVAVDDPYRGGYITRHYGRPEDGWHAIQLEINRDLYLDPLTLELRPRGFARLRADLAALVRVLGELQLRPRAGR